MNLYCRPKKAGSTLSSSLVLTTLLTLAPVFVWLLGEPERIKPVITKLAKYRAKKKNHQETKIQ